VRREHLSSVGVRVSRLPPHGRRRSGLLRSTGECLGSGPKAEGCVSTVVARPGRGHRGKSRLPWRHGGARGCSSAVLGAGPGRAAQGECCANRRRGPGSEPVLTCAGSGLRPRRCERVPVVRGTRTPGAEHGSAGSAER
jgi:hypothetical protein